MIDRKTFIARLAEHVPGRPGRAVAMMARLAVENEQSEASARAYLEEQLAMFSVALEHWVEERAGLIAAGVWPWKEGEDE